MMTFPTLPTDSLYKFLFVFGVLLIVASSYLQTSQLSKYGSFILKVDSLALVSKTKSDSIFEQLERTKSKNQVFERRDVSILDSLKKMQNGRYSVSAVNSYFKNISKFFLEQNTYYDTDRTDRRLKEVIKKLGNETTFQREKVENFQEEYHNNKFNLIVMLYTGLSLTSIGLLSWYRKGQRIQDKILALQLSQLELELTTKKTIGRYHYDSLPSPKRNQKRQ